MDWKEIAKEIHISKGFLLIKNQVKAGAMLSYLVLFTGNAITLFYTPFMLRTLGQSQYGLYSLANSVVGYLAILDFGFGNATVRYTAQYKAEGRSDKIEELHGMFFILYCIIGCFVFIASIVLSGVSNTIFSRGLTKQEIETVKILLILAGINLAISFPLGIFGSIITAYERFVFIKLCSLARFLVTPLILVPVLLFGYKSIGLIIATTILNIAFFILNYWYCFKKLSVKIHFKKIDLSMLKEISSYSFWIFLGTIIGLIWGNSGQFLLGIFSTTTAIAVFGLAMQLKKHYNSFALAISGVFLPRLTAMNATQIPNEEMSAVFIKIGRLQYIIVSLVFTGFLLFGKEFITLWAGKEYLTTYYIALIIFSVHLLVNTQILGDSILQAKNRNKFGAIVNLCVAVTCCILSIPLIIKYGPYGCAIGAGLGLVIGNLFIMNWYYHKKIGLNIPAFWVELLKMTPGILVPAISAWFILKHFQIYKPLMLLLYIFVYTIMYSFSTYFLSLNKYEKNLVFGFLKKNKK